jgi:2,4-dienoyl-CoA reductase-like NADH-dependent reductase (Old Yellow Enzyme family)
MTTDIATPLTLPCGITLKNRLVKAALTEGIADTLNRVDRRLINLYRQWASGGSGLLLTGNVQVDRRFLERPGNMVIDGNGGLDTMRALAEAGSADGTQIWMQINHPGRQTPVYLNPHPVAPSDVALDIDDFGGIKFGPPRALTEAEIDDIIRRFGHVAATAAECGFTGVQIHSAHGYLLSQFLSPKANRRTDKWGGPLENRARLLLEVVRAARRAVGPKRAVSVKLNSSDFQQGGFTHEDCLQVVRWLDAEGIDLLEISGGNYEQPSMGGAPPSADALPVKESTRRREAYFLSYAESMQALGLKVPLMVTGGFRSRAAMDSALASGAADAIGLGRPLCTQTDFPNRLLDGTTPVFDGGEQRLKPQSAIGYYYMNLARLAGDAPLYQPEDCDTAHRDLLENERRIAASLKDRLL